MKNLLTAFVYILTTGIYITITIISVQILDVVIDHTSQGTTILMFIVLCFMLISTAVLMSIITAEIIMKIRWRD